jgi:hypothetical protein
MRYTRTTHAIGFVANNLYRSWGTGFEFCLLLYFCLATCVNNRSYVIPSLLLFYSLYFVQHVHVDTAFSPNAAHGCLDRGSSASGWRYPCCVVLLLGFGYQCHRQSISLREAICRSSLSSHWLQGFLLFLATILHSYIIMVASA